MVEKGNLARSKLRTPKAAAIAGVFFSVLLVAAFWLLQTSIPADSFTPNTWLGERAKAITFALNLIPFAGIAFLWFIGVLRDRLGGEDRFFSTVFLGSGLLFLAMLFSAAAVASTSVAVFTAVPRQPIDAHAFAFARTLTFDLMNVYAIKMAGVFMISTSTVALYTEFVPRYTGFLGYVLALFLLLGSGYVEWSFFVFPLWVLLLSVQILADRRLNGKSVRSTG